MPMGMICGLHHQPGISVIDVQVGGAIGLLIRSTIIRSPIVMGLFFKVRVWVLIYAQILGIKKSPFLSFKKGALSTKSLWSKNLVQAGKLNPRIKSGN